MVQVLQVPADLYLGKRDVLEALGFQLAWAVALLALGTLATGTALRKVVIQGGVRSADDPVVGSATAGQF
ncbi:hypothetical protein ACFQVD_05615 [Streptosporangium amethystogenes subsp. fukuiense]|uniref:ABC transporter permease n=1 Tax=Streptosporangium amethystogenes subsp. fukuiense TaxID=698418 RepID=A0ABW2SU12_9ACTN